MGASRVSLFRGDVLPEAVQTLVAPEQRCEDRRVRKKNVACSIRPRINGEGVSKPMWVGNIFAWGSDKVGIGHNPKSDPDYNDRLTSHRRFNLPERRSAMPAAVNSER